VVADQGYYHGTEIQTCLEAGLTWQRCGGSGARPGLGWHEQPGPQQRVRKRRGVPAAEGGPRSGPEYLRPSGGARRKTVECGSARSAPALESRHILTVLAVMRRSGFALIEILVVIVVIAILATVRQANTGETGKFRGPSPTRSGP
jgi:prepilin-type N-terminal cleavage/methylation domain-containing protein